MNANNQTGGMNTKALLSTLWIFVLLNMIFRDIHELVKPEFLAEAMTGTVNGNQVTEEILLLGGIMVEIPIAMVLMSRVLAYGVNRLANIIAGTLAMVLIILAGPTDLDDIFFAAIEIVALAGVVWLAWKWPNPELSLNSRNQ